MPQRPCRAIPLLALCLMIMLSALITASCGRDESPERSPLAKLGVIDLTGKDFSKGSVKLVGEWKFYWGQFIGSEKETEATGLIEVPSNWNGHALPTGKNLGANGFASYRLTILLPPGEKSLAVSIPHASSAYRLYVRRGNEPPHLLGKGGTAGATKEKTVPLYVPTLAPLPAAEELDLIVEVANFHDGMRAGMWLPPRIGTYGGLLAEREHRMLIDFFCLGAIFIIGCYYFLVFLLRTSERAPLWLALFCFIMAARIYIVGNYYEEGNPGSDHFVFLSRVDYLTFYLAVPVFSLFLNTALERFFHRIAAMGVYGVGGIFSLLVVVLPVHLYSAMLPLYQVFAVIVCVGVIFSLFRRAVVHRDLMARISLVGILLLVAAVINDILYAQQIIHTFFISQYIMLGVILSQGFIVSFQNADARKKAERYAAEIDFQSKTLLRQAEDLKKMDRLKDEFVANTSHELRTPLNGIIGIAESLVGGVTGRLPDDTRRNLNMIISSGKRLASLVNDILDYSRLKSRDITLEMKSVDIKALVDLVVELLSPLVGAKPIKLVNDIPDGAPLLAADENRIQQVMFNLVGNAIKFTDNGVIRIVTRVDGGMIHIDIADTGIGMTEETIQRIFEPFELGLDQQSGAYGGTGLGLSISKTLVELHGGHIDVASTPGEGSCFTVSLPLRQDAGVAAPSPDAKLSPRRIESGAAIASSEPAGEERASLRIEGDPAAKYLIMVVDDDPVNLQVLENNLTLENYTVVRCTGGMEAIEKIESGLRPDLALMDVMMPRMNGYDATRRIRGSHTPLDLPILMLTAKNTPGDILAGFEAGANDYLTKPFERTELISRVRSLLTLKDAIKENRELVSYKKEIELARLLQQTIIDSDIPLLQGVDVAALYIPMESIGGDYFSVKSLGPGKMGVFLSDVAGHGVPAAMVASMVKVLFHVIINEGFPVAEVMTFMNGIAFDIITEYFFTAVYCEIDLDKLEACISRAGHEPVLIHRRNSGGGIEEFMPMGRALGITSDSQYDLQRTGLSRGDRIIVYTDCVTETFNSHREFFGIENFKIFIAENKNFGAQEFLDRLLMRLREWSGKGGHFDDDLSVIVVDIQ